MLLVSGACVAFTACTDEYDYDGPGEQDSADKAGVYFPSSNATTFEVDPEDPTTFTISVDRLNGSGALSVPLTVEINQDDVFSVPATAEFADGQVSTTVTVNYPNAEVGVEYKLQLTIPDEYVAIYNEVDGLTSYTATMSRIKWENIGVGYLLDGTVATFFGVDPSLPLAVEIETATVAGNKRFRFDSPFAYTAYDQDEIGYYGYPYNDETTCDGLQHMIILDVTSDGVSMSPVETGMNQGYGMFTIGSIYGNLSNNIDSYPLGTYDEKAGYIEFPKNSLFVSMAEYNDGGGYPCPNPTYLFLSADAYTNYMSGSGE